MKLARGFILFPRVMGHLHPVRGFRSKTARVRVGIGCQRDAALIPDHLFLISIKFTHVST